MKRARDPQHEDVDDIARTMLARYSSPKVAREMAYMHAMDHRVGDPRRAKWLAIYARIGSLAKRRDPPTRGERTRRRRQAPSRVQFRKLDEDIHYDAKEGDVIAIFVDDKSPHGIPLTRYYHAKAGSQWDTIGALLSSSHRASPREYARLERHLTRDHGYRLVVL